MRGVWSMLQYQKVRERESETNTTTTTTTIFTFYNDVGMYEGCKNQLKELPISTPGTIGARN